MVFSRLTHLLSLLLISATLLNPLAPTLAHATEISTAETFSELVRNTKEQESTFLKSEDPTKREEEYPRDNEEKRLRLETAFYTFVQRYDPKVNEPTPSVCEPSFLSGFQSALLAEKLPSDPISVRHALLVLRERNRIDDLTLMPLLAVYSAWEELGYKKSEWTRKDPEGRVAEVDCPTGQYLDVVSSVRAEKGRKMGRQDIRRRIVEMGFEKNNRSESRFLNIQIRWLLALARNRFDKKTAFSAAKILGQIAEAKNSSPRVDRSEPPTKLLSKRKKKSHGLSNRQALYANYSGLQINLLSDTFRAFTDRSDVAHAHTVMTTTYDDGRPSETYSLSPEEEYRKAVKMLHKDIEELKNSSAFLGKSPTFDDVIISALETGFVHASEADAVMTVDDLWNPNISGWSKFGTVLKKYGSVALILVPTPYTFFASLAIIIIEAFITKNTSNPSSAVDRGISIF